MLPPPPPCCTEAHFAYMHLTPSPWEALSFQWDLHSVFFLLLMFTLLSAQQGRQRHTLCTLGSGSPFPILLLHLLPVPAGIADCLESALYAGLAPFHPGFPGSQLVSARFRLGRGSCQPTHPPSAASCTSWAWPHPATPKGQSPFPVGCDGCTQQPLPTIPPPPTPHCSLTSSFTKE